MVWRSALSLLSLPCRRRLWVKRQEPAGEGCRMHHQPCRWPLLAQWGSATFGMYFEAGAHGRLLVTPSPSSARIGGHDCPRARHRPLLFLPVGFVSERKQVMDDNKLGVSRKGPRGWTCERLDPRSPSPRSACKWAFHFRIRWLRTFSRSLNLDRALVPMRVCTITKAVRKFVKLTRVACKEGTDTLGRLCVH
ncbi:hypothetical protein L209DRAFT_292898 [Thermothelomyces heterothallicus CBS 203.75]